MSFNSNNSRNVANLLRYQQLDPIPPKRQIPSQPQNIPPNYSVPIVKQRQQIPIDQAFTPQERQTRKKTPLQYNRRQPRQDDYQLETIKVRLDQIVKYYQQRHNSLQNKLVVRVNQLQNFIMREVPKIDNSSMLSSDLIALKQTIKDLRKTQEYQNNEITALKMMSNDRNSSQTLQLLNKQKQKSTVLFMQMVRLGDSLEKMSDYVGTISRTYQSKYQQLQSKLAYSQKNLMIMSQKSSSGSEVISELGEKVMSRLATSQTNLLILGKQQIKDKQAISKLMAQNDRMGDDLQLLLKNMQTDFQMRLQNRVQQTISRLMQEHQQRVRREEEIRRHIELKQKTLDQKQLNQKMENKTKYDTMDALVRNQLLKKQQLIRSLQKGMEDQYRYLMREMEAEGAKRKDQQGAFRAQMKKMQEGLRKQYDLYKAIQNDMVQKVSQMIKTEIETRVQAQLGLKKMTSNIANDIVGDMENIKQALATSNKKLAQSIRQISAQGAQRAGQLSHYIDGQIKKVVEVVTQKYSKMKSVFTKLAQQLRNHLQNTEMNRKNVQGRLTAIEQDFDKLKNEVNTEIDEFYNEFEARLKQQKQFVETVVFKKTNDLNLRVSKLQQYTNQYFELLKNGIQDNKQLLSKKITGLGSQGSGTQEEQLKRLQSIVFQIKTITQRLKDQNQLQFREIRKDISSVDAGQRQNLAELQSRFSLKINKQTEQQQILSEQINEAKVKLNSLRAESNTHSNSINEDRIKKLQQQILDVDQRISSNEKVVQKIASQITVIRAQINTLQQKVKK